MIALITSTLIPTTVYSVYDPDERLYQTINTIQKLRGAGFSDIYFFDNSINEIDRSALIKAHQSIKIFQSPQYSFKNKGLNEALLILNNSHHLPKNTPIFKISGRYYPGPNFKQDIYNYKNKEFIGVGYAFENKISGFSTKAYFVKDTDILVSTLVQAIEDMISYSKGIHGLKSGINALREFFRPYPGVHYQLSIEQSFARILKQRNNYALLDKIFIEGFEAGCSKGKLFTE